MNHITAYSFFYDDWATLEIFIKMHSVAPRRSTLPVVRHQKADELGDNLVL
jgi:hypothetical protein